MSDKAKIKARQASLLEQSVDKPDNIDKLVALAFDSDAKVRLKISEDLGKINDPRAIFALIELSSDKDESVKESAQRSLGNFKDEEAEIVSLGKLLSERKEVKQQSPSVNPPVARQSMMPTIEKLFAHYEPKKRESLRRKLMPSLQKIFSFKMDDFSDPLHELDKIAHTPSSVSSQPLPVPQQNAEVPTENAPNFPFGNKDNSETEHSSKYASPTKPSPSALEAIMAEKSDLLDIDDADREIVSHNDTDAPDDLPEDRFEKNKYYELAYTIATTPGMGKNELKREQTRLISNFKKEVEVSFKLAFARAKSEGFATFANLKPGMKNLSFVEMPIASITEIPYGSKKKSYLRISLWDQKKEIPLLVPKERGIGISVSDKIGLKKVSVDFLIDRNEVVLLATNKTSIFVVK